MKLTHVHEIYGGSLLLSQPMLSKLRRILTDAISAMSAESLGEGIFRLATRHDYYSEKTHHADVQMVGLIERDDMASTERKDGFPRLQHIDANVVAVQTVASCTCTLYSGNDYADADDVADVRSNTSSRYPLPSGIYGFGEDGSMHTLVMVLNTQDAQIYASYTPNSSDPASVGKRFYTATWLFYSVAQILQQSWPKRDKLLAYGAATLVSFSRQSGVYTYSSPEGDKLYPLEFPCHENDYTAAHHQMILAISQWVGLDIGDKIRRQ